jgi:hypothetical protein
VISKKLKAFLGLALFAVAVSGFTTAMLATMSVTRFGPFFMPQTAFDSLTGGQPGGQVRVYIVGGTTDTLLVGDVVYFSDTNKVTKSATLANYNRLAGVVVGGTRTDNRAAVTASEVGGSAGTSGQRVFVLKQGRTWIRSSQNAVIIAGKTVLPSDSIAGRFDTTLTAAVIDTQHRILGRTVIATAALGVGLIDVNVR